MRILSKCSTSFFRFFICSSYFYFSRIRDRWVSSWLRLIYFWMMFTDSLSLSCIVELSLKEISSSSCSNSFVSSYFCLTFSRRTAMQWSLASRTVFVFALSFSSRWSLFWRSINSCSLVFLSFSSSSERSSVIPLALSYFLQISA